VAAEKSSAKSRSKPKARRRRRAVYVRRWLGVGALCLIGLLYYRPLKTYVGTHRALVQRKAEVAGLRRERAALERKLAAAGTDKILVGEGRRLGYVKPGERLFIVKGLDAWRRAQRTIARHGR
jgi:cell division protein FtsB